MIIIFKCMRRKTDSFGISLLRSLLRENEVDMVQDSLLVLSVTGEYPCLVVAVGAAEFRTNFITNFINGLIWVKL